MRLCETDVSVLGRARQRDGIDGGVHDWDCATTMSLLLINEVDDACIRRARLLTCYVGCVLRVRAGGGVGGGSAQCVGCWLQGKMGTDRSRLQWLLEVQR